VQLLLCGGGAHTQPPQEEYAVSCFDTTETRDIDCQTIVAPQYGIPGDPQRADLELEKSDEDDCPIVES
jgi:hypothetical protein